ncbi:MAG: 4-vinyl reductase [Anaerolineales bacterium]
MNESALVGFPGHIGQMILCAMEEVIGKNGLSAALNVAGLAPLIETFSCSLEEEDFSFEMLGILQSALELAYGPRGGRGLALRSGRVFFNQLVREYGAAMGMNESTFRLQPAEKRIKAALDSLATFVNQNTDQSVQVIEADGKILWQVDACPLCWERHEREPVCQLTVGMLQECAYWASGGKIYNVVEEACIACGDSACIVVLDRIPLT